MSCSLNSSMMLNNMVKLYGSVAINMDLLCKFKGDKNCNGKYFNKNNTHFPTIYSFIHSTTQFMFNISTFYEHTLSRLSAILRILLATLTNYIYDNTTCCRCVLQRPVAIACPLAVCRLCRRRRRPSATKASTSRPVGASVPMSFSTSPWSTHSPVVAVWLLRLSTTMLWSPPATSLTSGLCTGRRITR